MSGDPRRAQRHRPVIGITSYVEPASWGAWRDVPAALVPDAYVAQVRAAGGLPVVVPPLDPGGTDDDARELLSRLDGLVLAGGADIEASRYGREPHPTSQQARPDRDASELTLARLARGRMPVLGICRGMQVLAVAAGGELEQHLPDRLGHGAHSPAPGTYGPQRIETVRGSRLHALLGAHLDVNCYHHQGVATHPGFTVAARSADGVVEAIEADDPELCLGVQWHPETGADGRLFAAVVDAAR